EKNAPGRLAPPARSGPLGDWSGAVCRGAPPSSESGASRAEVRGLRPLCEGSGRVAGDISKIPRHDHRGVERRLTGRSPLFRTGKQSVETAYLAFGCVYSCVLLLLLGASRSRTLPGC